MQQWPIYHMQAATPQQHRQKWSMFSYPKKTMSPAIEKLRIIVLFHAMFDMNNKRIGRDMIANAEAANQIPWEAYGSRKRHRAIECTANKVLTTDIA